MQQFLSDFEQDTRRVRQIVTDLQAHLTLYGYTPIDTPIIENAALFSAQTENPDEGRLLTFDWAGHRLALRPEFTSAALHQYINQKRQDIVRWQFSGPLFKTGIQDSQRVQQRYYVGAELIGMSGPQSEAEILSMIAHGLARQELKDWVLLIGHAGLTRQLLTHFDLDTATQELIHRHRHLLTDLENGQTMLRRQLSLDRLCAQYTHESGGDILVDSDAHRSLDVLGGILSPHALAPQDIPRYVQADRIIQTIQWDQVDTALDFLQKWLHIREAPYVAFNIIEGYIGDDDVAWQMCDDWRAVVNFLDAYSVPVDHIAIQPDWAYIEQPYTGIFFEIRAGDRVPLVTGGRYNEFIRSTGGTQTIPAMGFACDILHLAEACTGCSDTRVHTINLITGSNTDIVAAKWAQALRQRGVAVALVNAVNARADTSIVVREDGTLQFGQQFYTMEQIDFLMITLTGSASRGSSDQ